MHQKQMYGDHKVYKNITTNAHYEVVGDCYKLYCKEKVLASVSPQSVIAVDDGSDHGKKKEVFPKKSW
jgi:hypothetical protein